MPTYLLTGGCGFIGSNFARFALLRDPNLRIVNLDALTYSGNPDNLADLTEDPALRDRHHFVHGNILDSALVERLLDGCDAVIHMAAESHVDRSIRDSRPFVETNVLGTQSLLEAICRSARAGKFHGRLVLVSTDEVYGWLPLDRPDLQFTESTPLRPSSPYAASKAAGDLLAQAYHRTFGLDVCITRCSNNFGPYQFPEKIIPLFVTRLLENKKVPLYGDGKNVRDWLHVDDHCQAILAVLEKGRGGQVYNIGANNEHSNLELTHLILRIMGQGPEMIQPVADRPGHDRRYAMDARKIREELGWRPTRSAWPQALEKTVQWYVEHPHWWRRVQSEAYRQRRKKFTIPPPLVPGIGNLSTKSIASLGHVLGGAGGSGSGLGNQATQACGLRPSSARPRAPMTRRDAGSGIGMGEGTKGKPRALLPWMAPPPEIWTGMKSARAGGSVLTESLGLCGSRYRSWATGTQARTSMMMRVVRSPTSRYVRICPRGVGRALPMPGSLKA